jgi:leader peptidase (prepilin peptidase)/N-methyltransferase
MSVSFLIGAAITALGLVIGSFLNVVIHRVPRGESIVAPGSHCPHCKAGIKLRHNVPVVGWLLLRGRCASCGEGINPRYALVELRTALLFLAVTLRFGMTPALPAYLYFAAVALTLTLINLDTRTLPACIVLPSYIVGVLLLLPAGAARGDWGVGVRALAAMAALWGIYLALARLYPDRLGLAEIQLAGMLGLYLGWLSWAAVLTGAAGALMIAAVVGLGMRVAGGAVRAASVGQAPYLLSAAIVAVLIAVPLTNWYYSVVISSGG